MIIGKAYLVFELDGSCLAHEILVDKCTITVLPNQEFKSWVEEIFKNRDDNVEVQLTGKLVRCVHFSPPETTETWPQIKETKLLT